VLVGFLGLFGSVSGFDPKTAAQIFQGTKYEIDYELEIKSAD
jgi:hypothetical protein